jgi:acyl carrier protein
MEVVSWFEERLQIRMPDEELAKVRTLGDLRALIARLVPPGTQIAA